jgi:hypothetical protein
MTALELDLLSSMSFERPVALFVTDAVEMDTLKCLSYESWVGPFQYFSTHGWKEAIGLQHSQLLECK